MVEMYSIRSVRGKWKYQRLWHGIFWKKWFWYFWILCFEGWIQNVRFEWRCHFTSTFRLQVQL